MRREPSAARTDRLFALDGGRRSDPAVARWFAAPPAALRGVARRWFQALRSCGPDVLERLHDGHPTACVAGVAFGYVDAFAAHVNVGFFHGASLDDPARLLQGAGRFMRHVKLRPGAMIDEPALLQLVAAAYADIRARTADRPAVAPPVR